MSERVENFRIEKACIKRAKTFQGKIIRHYPGRNRNNFWEARLMVGGNEVSITTPNVGTLSSTLSFLEDGLRFDRDMSPDEEFKDGEI